MRDINEQGFGDRVLGMTASEFGRRVISNASVGTDHGVGAPMFLFGNKVQSGILGANPVISPQADYQDNIPMQYDFRSVYASVLKDWFCVPQSDLDLILLDTYQPLALVDPEGCITNSVHELNQGAGNSLLDVYPNPFTETTTVKFDSNGGRVVLQVFNEEGRLLRMLANADMAAGTHTIGCDLGDMPPGIYYCRLQNEGKQQVKSMLKVR